MHHDPNVETLIYAAKHLCKQQIESSDGVTTVNTLDIEMLERCIHAVDITYLPSYPDSEAMPCVHSCEYCIQNDVHNAMEKEQQ